MTGENDEVTPNVASRRCNIHGPGRDIVYDARERAYTLRGSETRTLSTIGAFRVISARDLRNHHGGPADPRSGDLRHLREQGLVRIERLVTGTRLSSSLIVAET
jgi:hypothetical protein